MGLLVRALLCAAAAFAATQDAHAQTIYPLDRAEILTGAKFDLKVEFPGKPASGSVTVNGQDAAAFFGKAASFIEGEEGGQISAFWLRDISVPKAGDYVIEAVSGETKAKVAWQVFDAPARSAKNVILFIGDGLSVAHRTAARVLSKGLVAGRYGGELAIDDMPHMALVSTSGTDALVTDSANSMSAYTTGHKSCVNALGVYCASNKGSLDHPKVETISEIVKRRAGMSVGVVTNTEIEDATPAGMVAHTRTRRDYDDIVKMFFKVQPDVILGGGSLNFIPAATPGGKRKDGDDYIKKFEGAGYKFVSTNTELKAATAPGSNATKLLGLFNTENIDGALDRFFLKQGSVAAFPDQPDLTDQLRAALTVLSKDEDGFVLMVESGRTDKYSHSLDWERAAYDTIMLDNAVKVAKDFAAAKNDTLIIVVGDHAHPVSIIGTYDDNAPGSEAREKLGVYGASKFPNYPAPNADGYPGSVDVSRRIAFSFGGYPDYCALFRPYLDGENIPTVKAPDGKTYVANEKYCNEPLAVRREGNLPREANAGVHSADDLVLTAMGPGAEQFHGRIDNTRVFRTMAIALGLGQDSPAVGGAPKN